MDVIKKKDTYERNDEISTDNKRLVSLMRILDLYTYDKDESQYYLIFTYLI